jgi:hypothetical protein
MGRYVIQNETTKGLKKLMPKYGSITVNTDKIKGSVKVVGYRKYTHSEEIDIEFTGKINARVSWGKLKWFDSSLLSDKGKRVSKVKINRFIKKTCLSEVKIYLNYFGVKLEDYSQIKKTKWI